MQILQKYCHTINPFWLFTLGNWVEIVDVCGVGVKIALDMQFFTITLIDPVAAAREGDNQQ